MCVASWWAESDDNVSVTFTSYAPFSFTCPIQLQYNFWLARKNIPC